jgi:autotransporter adhesin
VGRALAHLKYIQHRPGEDRRVANANAYTTAVYQNLSQKDQQLDNRINNLTSNSYRGIACAIALVSAPRPAPGKTGIGFGTGYYMGNAATALTMAHSSRGGHWQSSFGVATSVTGNSGANIAGGGGVLYQF